MERVLELSCRAVSVLFVRRQHHKYIDVYGLLEDTSSMLWERCSFAKPRNFDCQAVKTFLLRRTVQCAGMVLISIPSLMTVLLSCLLGDVNSHCYRDEPSESGNLKHLAKNYTRDMPDM